MTSPSIKECSKKCTASKDSKIYCEEVQIDGATKLWSVKLVCCTNSCPKNLVHYSGCGILPNVWKVQYCVVILVCLKQCEIWVLLEKLSLTGAKAPVRSGVPHDLWKVRTSFTLCSESLIHRLYTKNLSWKFRKDFHIVRKFPILRGNNPNKYIIFNSTFYETMVAKLLLKRKLEIFLLFNTCYSFRHTHLIRNTMKCQIAIRRKIWFTCTFNLQHW